MRYDEEKQNENITHIASNIIDLNEERAKRRKYQKEVEIDLDWVNSANRRKKRDKIYAETLKKVPPIEYSRKQKNKPKGFKAILKKSTIMVVLSITAVTGINIAKDKVEEFGKRNEITSELTQNVLDNTEILHNSINPNTNKPYYYYNEANIAQDILFNNPEFNIHTRIYGAYSNIHTSNREEIMDIIFKHLNAFAKAYPELDLETKEACNHETFKEYLTSLNITSEEYTKIMEQVITNYAKNEVHDTTKYNTNPLNTGGRI